MNLSLVRENCLSCHHRAEKKARLAVKDLYSKWQGGEKKLQLVMRFLAAARLCVDEKFSKRNV
jgi:hypothetical protein